MKKRTIAILAVAAVLVLGGIFVIAQKTMHRGFRGHGENRGAGMMMPLRALDLTDEQKAKVKEILDANRSVVQPVREQMKANHEKLAAMKGDFNEGEVTAVAKSQGELTAQLIVARQKVKSEIFAMLTDEQKAKAEEKRKGMQKRFKSFGANADSKTDGDE